jgi:Skp family chaperone for outer membrane proteins
MTKTFFSALVALVALASAAPAQAQDLRIGYVDTDQIVVRLPQFAEVQTQLRQEQQQIGGRVRFVQDSLGQVLQTQAAEYETFAQSALATDESRRERQVALVQLQNRIEQAEVEGLQFLSYREALLLQPILTSVDEAIQAEAEEGGYDLILPTTANNAPVFLYSSARVPDLTEPIMARLGISMDTPPFGQQAQAQQPAGEPPVVAPPATGDQ